MSKAYRCDKCGNFIEDVWKPEQQIIEKREEKNVVAAFEIMKPGGYDLCKKCGVEMIIIGLNREIQKEGGVATVVWDKKGGGAEKTKLETKSNYPIPKHKEKTK